MTNAAGWITCQLTVEEAGEFATERLLRMGDLSPISVARFGTLWRRFAKYARAHDVELLRDVDDVLVRTFIDARTVDGAPTTSTQHFRRAAIRLLFRVLRSIGASASDPTLDILLPPRSSIRTRPLTDDEVDLCRWAALATTVETRQPAAWALGEAGATTSEIPQVSVADWDPTTGLVRLPGGSRTRPRLVPTTEWGRRQLARRVAAMSDRGPDAPLAVVATSSAESEQASTCRAVHAVMRRAGVGLEADVRPGSLRAWAGRRVWTETGRVDQVAWFLGLRSLDAAAELIDLEWDTR